MPHLPDRSRFAALAAASRLVPVYRRLFADALTPLSAFARLDAGAAACLFESVVGGEKVGRYSFLGADPFLRLEARGRSVRVTSGDVVETFESEDPLGELERRVAAFRPARLPELPPFTSGAIGYAAYDAVRYVERLPNEPPDDLGLPDLDFAFYDRIVVFDNATKTIDVVVLARIDDQSPAGIDRAYAAACRRIDDTIHLLPPPARGRLRPTSARVTSPAASSTTRRHRPSAAGHFWKRSRSASNTSGPATSFRWSSAGGWRCPSPAARSRSIARCGS